MSRVLKDREERKSEFLDCLATRLTENILQRADEVTREDMDAIARPNTFFQVAVERLLGAPKGSVRLVDQEMLKISRDEGSAGARTAEESGTRGGAT